MPRRRTSVFEKMFSDNRLRSIPDSEQQGTLCVEYWTSKILIELSGYKSLELDDVQEMANIRVVKAWQQEIENDLYFAFTAQEEVGLRGAGAAAFAVEPDAAIAVDVTDTGDLPEMKSAMAVELGKGPAVKVMDRSVICTPAVVDALEQAAKDCGVSAQREILLCGGTDTSALQKARAGVQAGAVSIPTRYIHSPSELCAVSDVEDAAKLLAQYALQK